MRTSTHMCGMLGIVHVEEIKLYIMKTSTWVIAGLMYSHTKVNADKLICPFMTNHIYVCKLFLSGGQYGKAK